MIVYHADTFNQLCEGQVLDLKPAKTPIYRLYPDGVSMFGERAFHKPENADQHNAQIIDTVFDYVRCQCFPKKPSRFTSVFAAASLEDSKAWLERISRDFDKGTDGSSAPSSCGIYAVEASRIYIADARFLDCGNVLQESPFSLAAFFPFAHAYWDSVQELDNSLPLSDNQIYTKYELLLVPPVRVLYRVYP